MTPHDIIVQVAALMNDAKDQANYNDVNCLPYFNLAVQDLQEIFEQNNITYTSDTSAVITVPAGGTVVGRTGGPPQLPADLISIKRVWERQSGVDPYTQMKQELSLPHQLEGMSTTQFIIWVWENDKIKLLPCTQANDLKLDYVKSMFVLPFTIQQINTQLPFVNCAQFLAFRTASLCSMYIGENETRAQALGQDANIAIDRVLSIWSKGKQSIATRRRPLRAGYKARGGYNL